MSTPTIPYDIDTTGSDGNFTRRGNALSNKLTRVLSSSYADSEIRDALRLYDGRYGHGQDDLDRDLDLKYEAQEEVIEANARIVDDFAKVAQQLNRVGTLITTLNQTCDDIRRHVLAAKQETAPMLEEAATLLAQKQEAEKKQQLLDSFCKHFLISDEDLTTLASSAEPVNERFFDLLARVKQIHKDCELLLGYENQRLGLELMEQTTRNLNAAYKKLFNSTLRGFKGLDLEDPYVSGSIRRSLRALSERPALFQSCLDSFAEARQSTVSDAFQKALTDSTMGTARAIDFSTHDPLRYIGDMLAWVHSATVSEMEALEGLFISDADEISQGLHSGKSADPFSLPTEEGEDTAFDGYAALNSLISRNMSSVSHTLIQRISVTVRNLSDPVDIYKAYNVLSFYHDMFFKLIRHSAQTAPESLQENAILSTLTNLQSQTFKHFETTTFENLHSSIDHEPSTDLSPPTALSETLSQFTKIAQTRGPNLDTAEFAKLYNTLLKPLLDSCNALSDDLQSPTADRGQASDAPPLIYKLNCLSLIRDTLSSLTAGPNPIGAATSPLQHIQTEINTLTTTLTGLLSRTFTSTSGLDELRHMLAKNKAPTGSATQSSAQRQKKHLLQSNSPTPTQQPEDEPGSALESLAAKLDTFLAAALMDAQDELNKLVDLEIAKHVVRNAVDAFCEMFEQIVDRLEDIDEDVEREQLAKRMGKGRAVTGEVGGESDDDEEEGDDGDDGEEEMLTLREIYPRTLEEVRALLS
ncbi:Golgi transport complex subunit 6 [Exophiala xenobiotica]|uniref:Conserved oligomeric Golgi complex subunit 6 n=1 Tax=Lithohypha guttulata TaxID=1690604 RepID=A0ABR0K030_9EURO|nr:Golgi transport complex subunit 6 [Lithohypha guttulata]KAK5311544.1 Golgi transport complex subunit 6 [Exophiala xenobiotica]